MPNSAPLASEPAALAPAAVLALTGNPQHPLFTSWLSLSGYRVEFITAPRVGFEFPAHVDLVVGADTYNEPWVTLLRKAVDAGIPTLILADGILEYRNTWEHPQILPGAIFQPVLGHKLACLGRSQARFVESWGNPTQCEVVGSPRFDRYAGQRRRERPAGAPFRIIVMTALTPYFTEEQHKLVLQSLRDLKAAFARGVKVGDVRVEPVWRLTKGLDQEIGVDSVVTDLTGRQLAEVLQNVDAVITTPSTSMLEAMLLGLPVAALDYTNVPAYVQPAWRIGAAAHIAPTIAELVNPPAPKMLFQETTLHDALECATPAAPRLLRLAARMIESGREARAAGRAPDMAWHLAANDGPVRADHFDLAALYPDYAPFKENTLAALQVEVGHLRRYAAGLEQQGRAPNPVVLQMVINWKSKLEAGVALAKLQQLQPAKQLMLEAIKAVEACPEPAVTVEAIVAICAQLGTLDPGRTRFLLDLAGKLAEKTGQSVLRDRASQLLAALAEQGAAAPLATVS